MPTYEYKCTNDGSTFDIWQEVGSPAPPCPNCGAPTKKVFRPTRVIFKGSGFYVTDTRAESSASKTGGAPASDAKTDDAATEKTTESKSEKSADAPTETKSETAKTDAPANKNGA